MENNKIEKKAAKAKEEKKYTEAELNAACSQLYQNLMREIQKRDMSNMFRRMDYLFKVIENKDCFNDLFVHGCATEIETALTPVEPEDDENNVFAEKNDSADTDNN